MFKWAEDAYNDSHKWVEDRVREDYDNPVNIFKYETYVPTHLREVEGYSKVPVKPEKPDRKQCMPDPNKMIEAVSDGVDDAEAISEKLESSTMEQFINGGWALLGRIMGQLWTDTKKAQECMDEQDAKYKADVQEYVEDVLKLDEAKPAPIVYSKEQKFANFRQADEQRQKDGLSPITWFEYEAMVNKGLDPVDGSSLGQITNSSLCPHGGKDSGNAPVGIDGGGSNGHGSGSAEKGPSQSDGPCTQLCISDSRGNKVCM